jgi:hypothetical protein
MFDVAFRLCDNVNTLEYCFTSQYSAYTYLCRRFAPALNDWNAFLKAYVRG